MTVTDCGVSRRGKREAGGAGRFALGGTGYDDGIGVTGIVFFGGVGDGGGRKRAKSNGEHQGKTLGHDNLSRGMNIYAATLLLLTCIFKSKEHRKPNTFRRWNNRELS
jgi:hypothetical protein